MRTWQKVLAGVVVAAGVAALVPGIRIVREIAKALSGDPAVWAGDMARFAREDRANPPPPGVVVFTGSSSIALWPTLARDMSPLPAINRGFGGSRLADNVYWVSHTVLRYQPAAVVLFAGTNDISGRRPKTAQEVFDGYRQFVQAVHAARPQVPIYYIGITPTPARWKLWPIAEEANRLIQAYTETDPRLRFIDLAPQITGPDGRPERRLYRLDRLHPNQRGYARWTQAIKPILMADLGYR